MSKSQPQPSTTTKSASVKSTGFPTVAPPGWTLLVKRRVAMLARWLHIYLSMASFAILFFFAVTGLTLNHQEWFAKRQSTVQSEGTVDTGWVLPGRDPAKLNIVEYFRAAKGIQGAVNDFRVEESELDISFKGPGYAADIVIERSSGHFQSTVTRMGFFGILNDLHKGRDTGPVWAQVIDVSAVLMGLVSVTGTVLIFFLYKRRFSGLLVLGCGAVLGFLTYKFWVP